MPISKPTTTMLLNALLVGLLSAPVASSLQQPRFQSTRTSPTLEQIRSDRFGSTRNRYYLDTLSVRGGSLQAINFDNLQQRSGYSKSEDKIPEDTSITGNQDISTYDEETYTREYTRTNRPGWLSYLIPSRAIIPETLAESFGTFVLLHLVLGIVLSANIAGSMQGVFPIACLTGMGITAACAVVSSKCAAHFNPVITLAMCMYRNFGWSKFLPYATAQVVGSVAACATNYGLYAAKIAEFEAKNGIVRNSAAGLQTANYFSCYFADPVTPLAAFFTEAFGVFTLTSVVFALTSGRNEQVKGLFIPPIIGSTVAILIAIIGPVTCASLNPAREIGPRIVTKLFGWSSGVAFAQLPVYIAAAITGALAGGFFVDKILYPDPEKANSGKRATLIPAGSFQ